MDESNINYHPQILPNSKELGIGIVGCGRVAQMWHLTAYQKYGLKVVGLYDNDPSVSVRLRQLYPNIQVFDHLDNLLERPDIQIIDIATRPPGRIELINRVIDYDKHILAQKPLAVEIDGVRDLLHRANQKKLKIAINQNGRWCPQWRMADLMIKRGDIGNVLAVTHIYDTLMSWKPNAAVQGSTHFLIFDYSIHWIDITRCWLENKTPRFIQARDFQYQLGNDKVTQNVWIAIDYGEATSAVIRGVASAHAHSGHPFLIHGTLGTIRGSVDNRMGDWLELEKDGHVTRYELEGNWFPDGFAGTMCELLCAIIENREPYNSLEHNLLSFEMALAACQSAELGGTPIAIQ